MNNRLSPFYKNIALWLLITLVMIFLFNYFNSVEHARGKATINYSEFINLVKDDQVLKVILQGDEITGEMKKSGEMKDAKAFKSYAPTDPDLIKLLQSKGVQITAKPKDESSLVHHPAGFLAAHAGAGGHLDLLYAPDAVRRR